MVKISLLHPSRGRPQKAFDTAWQWIDKAGMTVEYILSLDQSDSLLSDYAVKFQNKSKIVRDNHCVVQATNAAAEMSTGDILVYLSDDFKCPDNWGELIIKEFENENRPLVLKVKDCLQTFPAPVLTIPIMNRQLYEKLGYFWHPAYKSMHVDVDLYWTTFAIGAIKNCQHLEFPHHHYSNGKAAHDETYKRSEANWDQGLEVLKRRRLEKFKI
jgi:hypothetical protein